jgi:hypothetical protein
MSAMSETVPGPNEALREVQRELAALGVVTRPGARPDTLEGEIAPSEAGGVTNPASWESIPRLAFCVSADARMRIGAPPALEGLAVDWLGARSVAQLVARIRHALRDRFARLEALRDRLQALGLKAGIDSQRLVVVSRVDLDVTGVVELEGGDFGLRARRLVPALGDRTPIALGDEPVELDELPDRVDVELCVAAFAEKALSERGSPRRGGVRPAPRPDAKDDVPGLGLLAEKLGADAAPHPGMRVSRSLVLDGREATFTARLAEKRRFVGRLSAGGERLWEGEFDLDEVTHLDEFAAALHARIAAGNAGTARPSRRPWSDADEELVAGLPSPAAGQRWVLDVHVEEDDGLEVRYRGLNVAGKPGGATRVLPRSSFERTFVPTGAGYRMWVSVLEVGADYVIYQTLDADRAAASSPRRTPLIVFMSNFTPESADL